MSSIRESVALRAVQPDDADFLYRVYASTREHELAQVDWTAADKRAFLQMQFAAQRSYYQSQFPDASFCIVEVGGEPAGRLYVDRRDDELRVIDIALLPQYRGMGIGGGLMRDILDEARASGRLVRIHVEQFNPALRLYERLGFARIEMQGVYYLMEWIPEKDG